MVVLARPGTGRPEGGVVVQAVAGHRNVQWGPYPTVMNGWVRLPVMFSRAFVLVAELWTDRA